MIYISKNSITYHYGRENLCPLFSIKNKRKNDEDNDHNITRFSVTITRSRACCMYNVHCAKIKQTATSMDRVCGSDTVINKSCLPCIVVYHTKYMNGNIRSNKKIIHVLCWYFDVPVYKRSSMFIDIKLNCVLWQRKHRTIASKNACPEISAQD